MPPRLSKPKKMALLAGVVAAASLTFLCHGFGMSELLDRGPEAFGRQLQNACLLGVAFSLPYQTTPDLVPGDGWTGVTAQPATIGSPGDVGYQTQVTARWTCMTRRVFNGDIIVTLGASHRNGIGSVSASVNNGNWVVLTKPIYSPVNGVTDTNLPLTTTAERGEYAWRIRARDVAADGKIEVRAIITPNTAGVPRVLQGGDVAGTLDDPSQSLFLIANANGTYDGVDYYVSPTLGSDGGGAYDGLSTSHPFATIEHALALASTGDRIKLMAGRHRPGQRISGANHNAGWITIELAPGVTADQVIIDPVDGNLMDLRCDYHCWHGLNIDTTTNRMLNVAWYRDCTITGVIPPTYSSSTSNTLPTVDTGTSLTFTTATGLGFVAGNHAAVWVTSDSSKFVSGVVTAYDSGTGDLTINVTDNHGGTGTFSSWTVQKSGDGEQWAAGNDWFTGCTLTNIWRECALQTPYLVRNCSVDGSRENGLLSAVVAVDVYVTDLDDDVDGHSDAGQWAAAVLNAFFYRCRFHNVGAGIPQTYFADQQITCLAILSCEGTSDGVNEVFLSEGNQFGKGDPDRDIVGLEIVGCTLNAICIYASDSGATGSRDVYFAATAASKFNADVSGIVTCEGCHAYSGDGGPFTNTTQIGTNTSGDDTMTTVFNADLTPKVALQNRIARILVATDANGNRRTQQDVGAYRAAA